MRLRMLALLGMVLVLAGSCAPAYAASPAYDYTNATATGNQKLRDNDGPAAVLVADMDATGLTASVEAHVVIDLWVSQNRPLWNKYARAELHAGGQAGTVVASHDFPNPPADATDGHQAEWSLDQTFTTDGTRYSVWLVPYNSGAVTEVWSNVRTFTVHQDAVTDPPPPDEGGGTANITCTSEEPCVMTPDGTTQAYLLGACCLLALAAGASLVSGWGSD